MGKKQKEVTNNQNIKCNVESCTHQDCDNHCCTLNEIEVGCTCGCDEAVDKKETICKNFKCDK